MRKGFARLLLPALLALCFHQLTAQTTGTINFQGVALDSLNRYIVNKPIVIQLSILDSAATVAYRERHSVTTDLFGQFNLAIGSGNVLSGSFATLNWADKRMSLRVEMDVTGGGNLKLITTQPFSFVPYAKYADQTSGLRVMYDSTGVFPMGLSVGVNMLSSPIRKRGNDNLAFGWRVLDSLTTGSGNIAIGSGSQNSNRTGIVNTTVGFGSLAKNTSGYYNVGVGNSTLAGNITATQNNAFGVFALNKTDSCCNNAFGFNALLENTKGTRNSAFGNFTMRDNTTGSLNSAFGRNALMANTTGNDNAALGNRTLVSNTTGAQNIGIGSYAGGRLLTGNNNVFIGFGAGNNSTYTNTSNKLIIHSGDSSTANPLIYGEFDTRKIKINGDLEITGAFANGLIKVQTNNIFSSQSFARQNVTAVNNNGYGSEALNNIASGNDNVAVGFRSAKEMRTGAANVAIGTFSLEKARSTSGSVAVGQAAILSLIHI